MSVTQEDFLKNLPKEKLEKISEFMCSTSEMDPHTIQVPDEPVEICASDENVSIVYNDGGWHNIKENRPEVGKRVLIATDKGGISIAIFAGYFSGQCLWSSSSLITSNVTHWRFLPDLPKKEE